jgi:hypothetical protein
LINPLKLASKWFNVIKVVIKGVAAIDNGVESKKNITPE